jgi:hypothetical protein
LTKRHQDEVCLDRAEQLRMKQEAKQREQEGQGATSGTIHEICIMIELCSVSVG